MIAFHDGYYYYLAANKKVYLKNGRPLGTAILLPGGGGIEEVKQQEG